MRLAHLHLAMIACRTDKVPLIEELRLEYDWKRYFPTGLEDALESMAANVDAEVAFIESRAVRSLFLQRVADKHKTYVHTLQPPPLQ